MGQNRTEISELGEFGLIDRLGRHFKDHKHDSTLKGIGDDAAVIKAGEGKVKVITTDMLVEGVHFDLSYVPLRHLGYKAVAVNISDVAAMNAVPEQITFSIAISNRFSVEAIEEIYSGIKIACDNYKVDLIGGDTTSSASGLIVSVTAIGAATENDIAYRSGANVNDILCVTGDLGGAYLGLQLLEREKQVFLANPDNQPEFEGKDYVLQKQLRPEARMDVIHSLKELGVKPTAMIDVSDGLASEIMHICKASDCGAKLYGDKLPLDEVTLSTAEEFNIDPITCMLNGGEEYELLFTIKQEDFPKLKNHPDISFIGHTTPKDAGVNLVTKSGTTVPVKAQGWVHF
ncbi:thiamine-phosphate kinase [Cytophagaceae bacterium ABcell3]|nr:thiamine-phosphate kinase [Cytophagaceae bacterium ABcell3]